MRARAAFEETRRRLTAAGVEDAAFDAAALVETEAGEGWRWQDPELDAAALARLKALAARRAAREPLQYILGRWPFLDFELRVGPGVLCPRADTELLCTETARRLAGRTSPAVLDLCAGSGCVGLGVKRLCPDARVTCLEKSPEAFRYLEQNAVSALPGFDAARPAVTCVRGDVFDYQRRLAPESLDLIVSNPPYVTDAEMATLAPEVRREPAMALRADREGLAFYEHIAPAYRPALCPGGWLAVEIGWRQGKAVQAVFRAAGYEKVACIPDIEGRDRVVVGQKPENEP